MPLPALVTLLALLLRCPCIGMPPYFLWNPYNMDLLNSSDKLDNCNNDSAQTFTLH